ncbi:hypothetical protein L3Q82_015065 [Scortum barcoo]|uniref:Uncharacterized protein n=1 Tax=Scortum barcoo TaxID=214431 RepID=A0ACB8VTT2_9TELE|nr:hypothetical protein L3Q82_015065 [Scortum barcoo]
MYPSSQVELRPWSAMQISALVVVNIIWWMVMLAAIGFGVKYLSQCTVQPFIPIYLVVLGASSLLTMSLTYSSRIWDDGFVGVLIIACMMLLHLFGFAWFIAGTAWVYPIYPPNYTPGVTPYCHKTAYLFAFVITTLVWAIFIFMFVCGCCCGLLTCCSYVTARDRLIPFRNSFYGATSNFREPTAGDV